MWPSLPILYTLYVGKVYGKDMANTIQEGVVGIQSTDTKEFNMQLINIF